MEHRYNPFPETRKSVTHEDMLATLAKRTKPDVKVSEVIETPKVELPVLDWQKPEKYYVLSTCLRYSVSKSFDNGVPRYTAWRRTPDFDSYIGIRDKPDEAKALCDAHLRAHPSDSRGPQLPKTAPDTAE